MTPAEIAVALAATLLLAWLMRRPAPPEPPEEFEPVLFQKKPRG